ncbi:MAG: L-asparaginase, partial [Chloroflexota bacterium]
SGRVFHRPKFQRNSFIAGDDLLPQKARVLLMLGLSATSDREQLQRMFREY